MESSDAFKPELFLPRDLPEMRRELVRWTRERAPEFWYEQHIRGSQYYLPPSWKISMTPQQAIRRLSAEHADMLDEAKLYSVTKEMTFLAQKTSMPEYELHPETLPSPKGLVVWQQPVGQAEETERLNMIVDRDTGEIEAAYLSDWVENMRVGDIPVLAASWELLPDQDQVMVVFYSSREGLLHKMFAELGSEDLHEARSNLPPMIFEREQLLPFGQRGWLTSEADNRLEMTAASVLHDKLSDDFRQEARKRDEAVWPMLDQMIKTLIATWMLMGMNFTKTDVELPDRHARKRMKREGANETQINSGVQVIRLGGPLRKQKPKTEGDPAFRWKKRRIVGPFVRRQWYPSEETHKPKLIEPYIAGPEGAPIGNAEKVYLLSE